VCGVFDGAVIVGGRLLSTLIAVTVVRRLVSHWTLSTHNDVAGFVEATTGAACAAVLAFVVVAVWENYAASREVADQEAGRGKCAVPHFQRPLRTVTTRGTRGAARISRVRFSFLFGDQSPYSQAAIMAGLTLTISLLVFVVSDAQHPFRGGFVVEPEGMESMLVQFGHPPASVASPAERPAH
jgi:hypothetical protein